MGQILCKRAYEPAEASDGWRVLVDRLWPRGVKKDLLQAEWIKEVTPSPELRRAYHAGDLDFESFAQAYRAELDANSGAAEFVKRCEQHLAHENVNLIYAAKAQQNHAQVLKAWLDERLAARNLPLKQNNPLDNQRVVLFSWCPR